MTNLIGKRALITGASGGIGGAIAKALVAAGASVAISGTRVEALEALNAELGGVAKILPCNLTDAAAVDALPGQAEAALGASSRSVARSCQAVSLPFRRRSNVRFPKQLSARATSPCCHTSSSHRS
jgi:3-oxoacyl-[acyl-carrier protein] reductase